MPKTQVQDSTLKLREDVDNFIAAFEEEFAHQATKTNHSSERRMRKLLRKFTTDVYEPYRDATLGRAEETTTQTPF